MKDLEKELKKLSRELSKLQEKGELEGYTLVGALAVSAHARPRATKDIDFLVSEGKDFFFKLFPEILKRKGYELKVFRGGIDDPINGLIRIYDRESGTELADIIPVIWNWQEEIVSAAEKIKVFDTSIPVARIEDLIVLKLKAGGPQYLLDAEELIKAAKISKKADFGRIKALAHRAKISKPLLSKFGLIS